MNSRKKNFGSHPADRGHTPFGGQSFVLEIGYFLAKNHTFRQNRLCVTPNNTKNTLYNGLLHNGFSLGLYDVLKVVFARPRQLAISTEGREVKFFFLLLKSSNSFNFGLDFYVLFLKCLQVFDVNK